MSKRLLALRFPAGGAARFLAGFLCCLLLAALPAAEAGAQDPALKQRYDEAFKAYYANPNDLQAVAAYARVAAELGDIEGAIGALERLAVQAPDSSDIQLQLGRLYYRLASYDAARSWYLKALSGNLSPADRASVNRDLAQIAALESPHRLAGSLLGGLAYQTNANAGSTSISPALGAIFTARLGPKSDNKIFASAYITDHYDLGRQDASELETRLALYGSRQFRLHSLDILLAEADSGPRMALGSVPGAMSIRPYVIGTALGLGNSLYLAGPGIGTNFAARLAPSLNLSTTFEARGLSFHNFASQPTARNRDAVEFIARGELAYALSTDDQLTGSVQAIGYLARRDFETYRQLTLAGAYVRRFAAPWSVSDAPWTLAFGGSRVWRPYGSPDPSIDPGTTRADREWTATATLIIGLPQGAFGQVQLSQVWVRSTVADYAYRDRTVSVAVGYSF